MQIGGMWSHKFSVTFTEGPGLPELWEPEVVDFDEAPWRVVELMEGILVLDLYSGLGGFAWSLAKARVPCLVQAFEVDALRVQGLAAHARFLHTTVSCSARGNALLLCEGDLRPPPPKP